MQIFAYAKICVINSINMPYEIKYRSTTDPGIAPRGACSLHRPRGFQVPEAALAKRQPIDGVSGTGTIDEYRKSFGFGYGDGRGGF